MSGLLSRDGKIIVQRNVGGTRGVVTDDCLEECCRDCWYVSAKCACSSGLGLNLLVPCQEVTAATRYFLYGDRCYYVDDTHTRQTTIGLGQVVVSITPDIEYGSCEECCGEQAEDCPSPNSCGAAADTFTVEHTGFAATLPDRGFCDGCTLPTGFTGTLTRTDGIGGNDCGWTTAVGGNSVCEHEGDCYCDEPQTEQGALQLLNLTCVEYGGLAWWQVQVGWGANNPNCLQPGSAILRFRRPRIVGEVEPSTGEYTFFDMVTGGWIDVTEVGTLTLSA